jgi:hypothetical protein
MKRMFWGTLAGLTTLIHILWAALIFLMGGLGFLDDTYVFIFLTLITLSLGAELYLGYCPFTKIEQYLRRKINPKYDLSNSFIAHHLNKFFKTTVTPKEADKLLIKLYIFGYFVSVLALFIL